MKIMKLNKVLISLSTMILCINCCAVAKTENFSFDSQKEWIRYANVRFTRCQYSEFVKNKSYIRDEVKLTKELGCDTLIFFVQNQVGQTLYNSKVAHKEPLMGDRDILAELIIEAKKQGIRVLPGWFGANFIPDDHPEWAQIGYDAYNLKNYSKKEITVSDLTFELPMLCFNSPGRKWLLDQYREVLENYDVAGIYLDALCYHFWGCWCSFCQQEYEKDFGQKIPVDVWDNQLHQFRRQTVLKTAREIREAVDKIKPGSVFIADCHGTIVGERDSCEAIDLTAPYIDAYILESYWNVIKEPAWFVGMESRLVRAETGKEVWSPKWLARSPGFDYTILSPTATKVWFMEALASGAGITTLDWGSFFYDKTSFPDLCYGHRLVTKLRPNLLKSKTLKYAAILHSMESKQIRIFADPARERKYFEGFYMACQEAHIPFDVITEKEIIDGTISQYPVLILPNVEYMSDNVAKAVEKYIDGGGGLVMTHLTGLYDENQKKRDDLALARLAGFRFTGKTFSAINFYQAVSKSPITEKLGDNMYSYRGALNIIEPNKDTKVLIMTRGYAPPPDGVRKFSSFDWCAPGELEHPLLITTQRKGRIVYIAGELDAAVWSFGWPEAAKILSHSVLYAAKKNLPFSTDCPQPVMITALAAEDGNSMTFLMVNYATNQLYSPSWKSLSPNNPNMEYHMMRTNEMRYPIVHKDITLTVPAKFKTAWSGTGQKIKLSRKDSKTIITIPRIEGYEAVVLTK